VDVYLQVEGNLAPQFLAMFWLFTLGNDDNFIFTYINTNPQIPLQAAKKVGPTHSMATSAHP
jgi:hypothetical protein